MPAIAEVGGAYRVIDMVDVVAGQTPFDVCHWKMLVPTPSPVMPVVFKFGLVIVAVPDNKLQVPVPTDVVFAAIVAVVTHTDCDGPALATVG